MDSYIVLTSVIFGYVTYNAVASNLLVFFKALTNLDNRCVKSVHIWSFSGPYLPTFELNMGKYEPEKLQIRTLFTQ